MCILSTDINECETGANDCDANAECINTLGGYNCTCIDGFSGDGTDCIGKNIKL